MLQSDNLWVSPRTLDTGGGANLTNDRTGGLPFRRSAPDTSRRAAEAAARTAPTIRARLLDAIREAGPHGLTNDESAALLGAPIQSVGPRCLELREAGLVVDSKQERRTRWGKHAIVWIVPEFAKGAAS